jgi:hypothetical protein
MELLKPTAVLEAEKSLLERAIQEQRKLKSEEAERSPTPVAATSIQGPGPAASAAAPERK